MKKQLIILTGLLLTCITGFAQDDTKTPFFLKKPSGAYLYLLDTAKLQLRPIMYCDFVYRKYDYQVHPDFSVCYVDSLKTNVITYSDGPMVNFKVYFTGTIDSIKVGTKKFGPYEH